MRITAIVYIILSLVANFIFDNLVLLVLAMLSFPLLLFVLLKKQKTKQAKATSKSSQHNHPPVVKHDESSNQI